jgi:SAM-dependent methyltransferase
MPAPASAEAIREVNVRYHDAAAGGYDAKWGIDFGGVGGGQVLGKVRKALGGAVGRYERGLEIGAGTGYFALNLMRAGVLGSAVCTDISPGMLATLRENAQRLGLEVQTTVCEAQALPFEDECFDVVLGHAVLHHLPDLPAAFAEFDRVLAPGGTVLFAGEPSRRGDRLAALPKRGAHAVAPAWRALLGARPLGSSNGHPGGEEPHDHHLERFVDVHSFAPEELQRLAGDAGLCDVRVRGEELLANWFGWVNRALEATAEPDDVPRWWRQYAFRGYLFLQEVDRRVLESHLPPAIFYNLILAARKPPTIPQARPDALTHSAPTRTAAG